MLTISFIVFKNDAAVYSLTELTKSDVGGIRGT